MYNAYLATRQKTRKPKADSPATAGMAKTPAGGAKSHEELKAIGERNGWTSRELSLREINAMSADETLWHEMFNRENFDNALTCAENQRVNRERQAIWDIRKKWAGTVGVTPEEAQQTRRAGAAFAERFPTFERSEANALKICQYMADHDLDPKQVSSYVEAFHALVETGQMKFAAVQSADEYLAANADTLVDKRVPPLIQARKAKAENTQSFFEKAAAATTQSTVTTLVDYPGELSGYPAAPTRYSFKKLLDSLDAESYRKRINDDPAFAAAVDKLQNGNR